jgi:SPP1 gp7 family putative phage head morphogenesis protein
MLKKVLNVFRVRWKTAPTTNPEFQETHASLIEEKSGVSHWESYAVTDGRICRICQEMHGKVFSKMDHPKPPYHDGCRCAARPLIAKLSAHDKIISRGRSARSARELLKELHSKYPRCWAEAED